MAEPCSLVYKRDDVWVVTSRLKQSFFCWSLLAFIHICVYSVADSFFPLLCIISLKMTTFFLVVGIPFSSFFALFDRWIALNISFWKLSIHIIPVKKKKGEKPECYSIIMIVVVINKCDRDWRTKRKIFIREKYGGVSF